MSSDLAPERPRTIGRYLLIATIGSGGMAEVFLAVAQGPGGFNKLLVTKVLRSSLADDDTFRSMFLDEARLAARMNHPNIPQTYEVGESDGHHFLTMEYLEGQPFNRVSTKVKEMPLEHRVHILAQVLAGLHYAHELTDYDGSLLDVVHRDISPHNVFVTYDGQVKLMDFGIAKTANASTQTATGVIKGKISYMAPEQALAQPVDRRTDIFAVGVMLWEALAGRRMNEGDESEVATLQKRVSGPVPSPLTANPEAPQALVDICMKAVAFDPKDRFASAADFPGAARELRRNARSRREAARHRKARDRGVRREAYAAPAVDRAAAVGGESVVVEPAAGGPRARDDRVAFEPDVERRRIARQLVAIEVELRDDGDSGRTGDGDGGAAIRRKARCAGDDPDRRCRHLRRRQPARRVDIQRLWTDEQFDVDPGAGDFHSERFERAGWKPGDAVWQPGDAVWQPGDAVWQPGDAGYRELACDERSGSGPCVGAEREDRAGGFGVEHSSDADLQRHHVADAQPAAQQSHQPAAEHANRRRQGSVRAMRLRAVALAALVLLPASVGSIAHADPPAGSAAPGAAAAPAPESPKAIAEGRQHFSRAVDLFKDADYRAALIEFRRASEVAPNFRIMYNLGQTYYELQDYVGALRSFQAYLDQGGKQVPAARRAQVEADIEKLKARVAYVTVTTDPPGADVTIDDVSIGKTPMTEPFWVSAGRRKIAATLNGHTDATQTVDLAGGDKSEVKLSLPGHRAALTADAGDRHAGASAATCTKNQWSIASAVRDCGERHGGAAGDDGNPRVGHGERAEGLRFDGRPLPGHAGGRE